MKEIRNTEIITNADTDNRHVEGYAIVFNSESVDLGGFIEVIDRNAVDGVIEVSDVLCLLDHNKERGVLARSKYGKGSLKLEIDDHGLKYSFDAPNTALGDELLEGIRRGDITTSSFGFVCEDDDWIKREDGMIVRYIHKIKQLYDVSPVYNPAYEATEVKVDTRGLDKLKESENMAEEKDKEKEVEEVDNTEKETEEEVKETEDNSNEENRDDSNEEKEVEDTDDNEENGTSDEEKVEEKEEDSEEDKENRNNNFINKNNHNIMKKNFSLIGAIRSVVNENGHFDEVAEKVIKEGRSAANKAGVSVDGQIVLPLEHRADPVVPNGIMAGVETFGNEAIPTDTWDIVGALRDRMVLADAGAQMINLQGNVEIPVYSGANCTWEDEIGEAKDGSGKFKSVKLTPKRLTATLPISKQFIIQSSESAEALLRQDLINCVAEKLQKTILGDGEGSATEPKGLFADVTADTAAIKYDDVVEMEAELESANVYGNYQYIMSPLAKAKFRTTSMDKGSGRFIYENDAVLGIDAHSTNSVVSKGVVLGDWKELIIGSFGSLDITVDPYTAASKGQIILTVNAYFDYVARRPEAFVKRVLA